MKQDCYLYEECRLPASQCSNKCDKYTKEEPKEKIKVYATEIKEKIAIIDGTRCDQRYCRESGCDFPDCASFSGEEFNSIDEAKTKYRNLELV